MSHTLPTHSFPSYHLESLLKALHLSSVTAKSWAPPRVPVAPVSPLARLKAAVAELDLPPAATANPRFTQSRKDIARAVVNIETWQSYLPHACVRAMVLDGWHWTT